MLLRRLFVIMRVYCIHCLVQVYSKVHCKEENKFMSLPFQKDELLDISKRRVQQAPASITAPDCFGFLYKLGARWHQWKRRYCVLKDASLFLYHDTEAQQAIGSTAFILLFVPLPLPALHSQAGCAHQVMHMNPFPAYVEKKVPLKTN